MAILVEQQDQTIKQIEGVAIDVNVNTEKGLASTEDAVRIGMSAPYLRYPLLTLQQQRPFAERSGSSSGAAFSSSSSWR